MATLTEGRHAGEFIVSEANGARSREAMTIDAGSLEAGTVLGRVTATGKYVALAPGSEGGSEAAAGILYAAVDATAADAEGVAIVRDAEVNGAELTWPAGISGSDKTAAVAALAALGVIVR